jgi:hypothetical protein
MTSIWDVWHAGTQVFPDKRSVVNEKEPMPIKKFPENIVLKESDYQNVVEKNLFSPDRAPAPLETEVSAPEVEEEVRISGEKVTLYGVIILDDYKKALTNDPIERSNEFKWISEGEKIGNLTVQQIAEDNIQLSDKDKVYRILLNDPEKIKNSSVQSDRKSVPSKQPEVISAGVKPQAGGNKKTKQKAEVSASADDEYEIVDTPFGPMKKKRK